MHKINTVVPFKTTGKKDVLAPLADKRWEFSMAVHRDVLNSLDTHVTVVPLKN